MMCDPSTPFIRSSSATPASRTRRDWTAPMRLFAAATLSVAVLSAGSVVQASIRDGAATVLTPHALLIPSQRAATIRVVAAPTGDGTWAVAGDYNAYLAVDAPAGRAFAINTQGIGSTLTFIDPRTGARRGSVPLAGIALAEIADPQAHRLAILVGKKGLELFDSRTGALVRIVPDAKEDNGLAVSPGGDRIIAFGGSSGATPLTLINAASGSVVASPRVGVTPASIRFDATNRRTFVLSTNDNLLTEFDTLTGAVIASLGVAETPQGLAIDPVLGRVFVVAPNESKIEAYQDPKAYLIDDQPLMQPPAFDADALVVDPGANRMVLANRDGSATIFSEKPVHILGTIPAGFSTTAPGIDRVDGTTIVAAAAKPAMSMVVRLRDGRVKAVELLPGPAKQVATAPALSRAYIVGDGTSAYAGPNGSPSGNGFVVVINGATGGHVGQTRLGAMPNIAAISSAMGRVYVDEEIDGYPTVATLDLMGRVIGLARTSSTRYIPGHD